MRQLGRLYEALLAPRRARRPARAPPQTVEAITARHRVGLYDETFQVPVRLGTGVRRSTPSRWVGTRRRAHSATAARSSAISFADPEHGLVAVVQTNGMCGNDDHYLRLDAVTTALYEDLGLAPAARPGRDKPFPSVELTVPSD